MVKGLLKMMCVHVYICMCANERDLENFRAKVVGVKGLPQCWGWEGIGMTGGHM